MKHSFFTGFAVLWLLISAAAGDVRVNDIARHDQTHPAVAVDLDDSYVYVAYQDYSSFQYEVYLAVSENGGMTFTPSLAPYPTQDADRMMPDVAVGPDGTLYLAWADFSSQTDYDIYLAQSDDHGATFAVPVLVTDVPDKTQVEPALAVGGDGTVYLAWADNRRTTSEDSGVRWDVYVTASDDGGATFSSGVALNQDENTFAIHPDIAATTDGAVVVWFDFAHRILLSQSHDAGLTWAAPVRLDADDGAFASMPRVAVQGDTIFVVWNDGAESAAGQDPNLVYGSGLCLDVYAAYSEDNGATWSPPFRVNQEVLLNQQYPAVSLDGPQLIVAWSDDRLVGDYTMRGVFQFAPWSWPAVGGRLDEFPGVTLRDLPDLAGPALVWQDYRNGDWDIYFKWLAW